MVIYFTSLYKTGKSRRQETFEVFGCQEWLYFFGGPRQSFTRGPPKIGDHFLLIWLSTGQTETKLAHTKAHEEENTYVRLTS